MSNFESSTVQNDQATKHVCYNCIGDMFLKNEIQTTGTTSTCNYCGETAPSICIDELADRLEEAFSVHYARTSTEPDEFQMRLFADRESNFDWVRDGQPVIEAIQEAAGIAETIAADVLEILSEKYSEYPDKDNLGFESEFDPESYYKSITPTDATIDMLWDEFEESLKNKARFFNRSAESVLTRVFGDSHKLKTFHERPIIAQAGPGTEITHIYRARTFQSEGEIEEALCFPEIQIGSPPAKKARGGRMNAQGISVFYGAKSSEVAIAEVRPPVGSRVVIAKFEIVRPLQLFDLTATKYVNEKGSIFDPAFAERVRLAIFLHSLEARMVRPVMPDDEAIEYLPTQAVADFLATTNTPRLDGIIFPSVQVRDGINIVLFNESARVAEEALPNGMEVESSANTGYLTEEGRITNYYVKETVQISEASKQDELNQHSFSNFLSYTLPEDFDRDQRQETLRLDRNSLVVHHVASVQVVTIPYEVRRVRVDRKLCKNFYQFHRNSS